MKQSSLGKYVGCLIGVGVISEEIFSIAYRKAMRGIRCFKGIYVGCPKRIFIASVFISIILSYLWQFKSVSNKMRVGIYRQLVLFIVMLDLSKYTI